MNRWNLRYVEKRIRNVGLLIGLERETNNNNNMMNDEKKAKKKCIDLIIYIVVFKNKR